jgi:hypothetical protein
VREARGLVLREPLRVGSRTRRRGSPAALFAGFSTGQRENFSGAGLCDGVHQEFRICGVDVLPDPGLRLEGVHSVGGHADDDVIPDHVPILSVSSSIQLYRMADGKTVAASDHVSGNILLERPEETATVEYFVRDLIGLAHPRSESVPLLEGLLHA